MEIENKGKMQGIAVSLEMALRNEYKCERYGLGGIANSDAIRINKGSFYYSMIIVLLKNYADTNSNLINDFININSEMNYPAASGRGILLAKTA